MSAAAHRQLGSSENETRSRLLLSLVEREKAPEPKTKPRALALSASLAASSALVLGYAHSDLLFNLNTIGATLLVAGGASGIYGAGWLRRTKDEQAQSSAFAFRLLNPASRFAGALSSIDDLCGHEKFPEAVEKEIKSLRERDTKARQAELEARTTSLLAQVKGLSAAPADGTKPLSAMELVHKLTPRLFVLSYVDPAPAARSSPGRAGSERELKSRAERFGDEVSLLLSCVSRHDEVLITLTSPGGRVSEFGLAASHLLRLRKAGVHTTVAIDTIAASGGYMMAACADHICAAPFAFVGSIGVVAEVPNVHRVLAKNDVDWLLFTAGKFKRTVTMFSESTADGKAKFQADMDDIHDAFKQHVATNRSGKVDVEQVATGEVWLAQQAMDRNLGLVSELCTSHDVILRKAQAGFDVIEVTRKERRPSLHTLFDRLLTLGSTVEGALGSLLSRWPLFGGAQSAISTLDDVARLPSTAVASSARAQ